MSKTVLCGNCNKEFSLSTDDWVDTPLCPFCGSSVPLAEDATDENDLKEDTMTEASSEPADAPEESENDEEPSESSEETPEPAAVTDEPAKKAAEEYDIPDELLDADVRGYLRSILIELREIKNKVPEEDYSLSNIFGGIMQCGVFVALFMSLRHEPPYVPLVWATILQLMALSFFVIGK